MVQVLDHLHQYVPTISSEERVSLPDGKEKAVVNDVFHSIGLGEFYVQLAMYRLM